MGTELPPFDKYAHYDASVQSAEWNVFFLDELYRDVRGRHEPQTLREDFCGTFANCCEWVRLGADRRAIAVDIDPEPLAYGCDHYWSRLRLSQQLRVQILQESVLEPGLPPADVIAALNFSTFFLKRRADLLAYFRNCHGSLEPDGLFVLDCFGGPAAHEPNEEATNENGYTFFFEQEGFDPLTHAAVFQLNFQRAGERKRRRVFTLDARMWTLPELRDLLLEAGFAAVLVYWAFPSDDGDVEPLHVERIEEEPDSWQSFVVGVR
jgi:SAM-dependent methyltransferase